MHNTTTTTTTTNDDDDDDDDHDNNNNNDNTHNHDNDDTNNIYHHYDNSNNRNNTHKSWETTAGPGPSRLWLRDKMLQASAPIHIYIYIYIHIHTYIINTNIHIILHVCVYIYIYIHIHLFIIVIIIFNIRARELSPHYILPSLFLLFFQVVNAAVDEQTGAARRCSPPCRGGGVSRPCPVPRRGCLNIGQHEGSNMWRVESKTQSIQLLLTTPTPWDPPLPESRARACAHECAPESALSAPGGAPYSLARPVRARCAPFYLIRRRNGHAKLCPPCASGRSFRSTQAPLLVITIIIIIIISHYYYYYYYYY